MSVNELLEVRNEYLKFFGLLLFFGALMVGAAALRPILLGQPIVLDPTATPAGLLQSFVINSTDVPVMVIAASPTPLPTLVSTPTPPPTLAPVPAEPTPGIYTVRPGDNLFRIGERFGVSVSDLVAANGLVDRNLIRAGQELVIPGVAPILVQPAPPVPMQVHIDQLYVVKPGDTFWRISIAVGVEMETLAAANHILDVNKIRAGQVLAIP